MVKSIYLLFELGLLFVAGYFGIGYIYYLTTKEDQNFKKADMFEVIVKWPFYMRAQSKRRR